VEWSWRSGVGEVECSQTPASRSILRHLDLAPLWLRSLNVVLSVTMRHSKLEMKQGNKDTKEG